MRQCCPAKIREIHKHTQNAAKFGRNLIEYMLVQQFYLNLSQLNWGYLLAVNLQIIFISKLHHYNVQTTSQNYGLFQTLCYCRAKVARL